MTAHLLSFPRRAPLRAVWPFCCAVALLGLLVSTVIPEPRHAVIPIGFGWMALWLGWALSWIGLTVDKVRGRRGHRSFGREGGSLGSVAEGSQNHSFRMTTPQRLREKRP